MGDSDPAIERTAPQGGLFPPTHWSLVLTVGQSDPARSVAALEELCQLYWYPIYAFLRRQGHREHDAEDLTQGFFVTLLKRGGLERVVAGRAKFRTYLLSALKNYLSDDHDRQQAQKRGGGREAVSLDAMAAEHRYQVEPKDTETPERLFQRTWATTVIDAAMVGLEQLFAEEGKSTLFEHLREFIVEGAGNRTYGAVAEEIGMNEEAVKKAVQRLRRRFRDAVREEIAKTVSTKTEIDEELRDLMAALTA